MEVGIFESADKPAKLYVSKAVVKGKQTMASGRIGDRSTHTWSVLRYLGFPDVKTTAARGQNGNLVGPLDETREADSDFSPFLSLLHRVLSVRIQQFVRCWFRAERFAPLPTRGVYQYRHPG